jgi:hypothetical protein
MGSTIVSSTRMSHGDSLGDALRRIPPLLPAFAVLFVVVTGIGLLLRHTLDGVTGWDTDVVRELVESRTDTLNTLTDYGTWLAETVTSSPWSSPASCRTGGRCPCSSRSPSEARS